MGRTTGWGPRSRSRPRRSAPPPLSAGHDRRPHGSRGARGEPTSALRGWHDDTDPRHARHRPGPRPRPSPSVRRPRGARCGRRRTGRRRAGVAFDDRRRERAADLTLPPVVREGRRPTHRPQPDEPGRGMVELRHLHHAAGAVLHPQRVSDAATRDRRPRRSQALAPEDPRRRDRAPIGDRLRRPPADAVPLDHQRDAVRRQRTVPVLGAAGHAAGPPEGHRQRLGASVASASPSGNTCR